MSFFHLRIHQPVFSVEEKDVSWQKLLHYTLDTWQRRKQDPDGSDLDHRTYRNDQLNNSLATGGGNALAVKVVSSLFLSASWDRTSHSAAPKAASVAAFKSPGWSSPEAKAARTEARSEKLTGPPFSRLRSTRNSEKSQKAFSKQ